MRRRRVNWLQVKGDREYASVASRDGRILEEFKGVKDGKTAFERACEWAKENERH